MKSSERLLLGDLSKWLDSVFEAGVPADVMGIVFNIYEGADNRWSIEVVGTPSFDKNNDDWACVESTDFGTREKPFSWVDTSSWDVVLSKVRESLRDYLEVGRCAHKLKAVEGVATGFVDGGLEIVFTKRSSL